MDTEFTKPWVLLCEGVGDERFFESLFAEHQFGSEFQIIYPHKEGRYGGGRNGFGSHLAAIAVAESFLTVVKAVLIVSDNDTADSFKEVQEEIRKAKVFPIPVSDREPVRANNFPSVVVAMVPSATHGNLESLCLESAYEKWPLKDHLDTFVKNCPAHDWSVSKQAKMRVQTMLAATNKSQPDSGFAGHWRQPSEYKIPLDHDCFKEMINFLKGFGELVS